MNPKQHLNQRITEWTGELSWLAPSDKEAISERLSGHLNRLDILGHTFYIDIPMDKLRPKDDLLSKGISFADIDHYLSEDGKQYQIPYNPKTLEFEELDYWKVRNFPEHLRVIEFPNKETLDPIGYCRSTGFALKDLKEFDPSLTFNSSIKAKEVYWEQSYIGRNIRENQREKTENLNKKERLTRKGKGRKNRL